MATTLSNRVLARRQKDLDGYNDDYEMRLEVMTQKHVRDLDKTWQAMNTRLEGKIKDLYAQAGAIVDPKKLKTINNKIVRMAALQANLAADIGLTGSKLQPYLTGIIKNQFEDSYYMKAFAMEQALKVSVVVPVLTPAMVLGVMANPWLGDGATYAQRLSANMTHFAKGIRDSVATAVSDGLGWSETAQLIRGKTQEGYFNSVRLARTELTRASAQGASYAYMENSDILDGKRWNATKDSRTAPKDAVNDGKQYDLDYDTTENPGKPGERIPNHPHCRCLWSPVLSALGVQDKERIARDTTDTPKSWGKNYYTKAPTYREYAKERGLPDIDAALASDNYKKYLRPGETAFNSMKTIKRWTYGGGTIMITKPDWEAIKVAPSTVIPKPGSAPVAPPVPTPVTFGDKVRARIAKGVATEKDISEVGGMIRGEIGNATVALTKKMDDLEAEGQGILDMLNETQLEGPGYDEAIAKFHKLGDERDAIRETLGSKKAVIIRDVFKDIRPIGPTEGSAQAWIKGSPGKIKRTIDDVREFLPTAWVDASDLQAMKGKNTKRGFYREADLKDYAARGYTLEQLTQWKALDRLNGTISLSGDYGPDMLECGFHEMGHRMEDIIPGIKKLENEFYARRTKGEDLKWLGGNYAYTEKTRKDNFLSKYMGKDYGNTETSFYELLSMGLESVFTSSYDLSKDNDFQDFILGIIAAK